MNTHAKPIPPRGGIPTLRSTALLLLPAAVAAFSSSAIAQTSAPESTEADQPLVMSPFEVQAELDTGYLASTAQSGTRLRTELKDIASSVSVVTKDFMNDIGANDLEGLLVYTLGTEVNGVGGNFSDAGVVSNPNGAETDYDSAFASASPSTRVRGLTSADLSRDFFITGIPLDSYNVERVEISRGPNAMLFGLGSPSGIINYSLIKGDTNRNRTSVELETDKYGSFRTELDHNQVLIKDKLAVRVAGLYEDEKYRVEEAWKRHKRAYLTATYRPFRNTTIRASTEQGSTDSNLPEVRPPFDAYTQWWYMGRPAWNPSTNSGRLLGTPAPGWPTTVFTAAGTAAQTGGMTLTGINTLNTGNLFSAQVGAMGGGSRQMVLVYNDPTSSEPSLGLPGSNAVGLRYGNYERLVRNPANTAWVAGSQTNMRGPRDWSYILNRVFHYNDITYNFWKAQQITDPALFDFYNHMLHGPNKHEWSELETYNVTLEQQLFDGDGGFELAFNRDRLDNGATLGLDSVISGYTLRVDMNEYLGNGQPNPNFGRPYTTAYSKATLRNYDRETLRATAYYNLDLRDLGSERVGQALGQHRLTATYTELDNEALLQNNNFAFASGIDYSLAEFGQVNTMGSAQRGLPIIRYLGPDVSGSETPVTGVFAVPTDQWPSDLQSARILYYNTPDTTSTVPGTWEERNFSIVSAGEKDVDDVRRNVSFTREKVESTVGVVQSYWFGGNLVSTVGWRKDDVRTYNAGTARIDPATGLAVIDDEYVPELVTDQSETSFNYGVVAHTPEFINRHLPLGSRFSLIYNQADNFRPAGQRYDFYDRPIPAETGETKEYGVMVSTFDGRLVLKATKYETISAWNSDLLASFRTPKNNLVSLIDSIQTEVIRGTNGSIDDPANPFRAGLQAWSDWYNGEVGQALRNTFRIEDRGISPNGEPNIVTNNRGDEVVSTADVKSTGEEYEIVYNPTPNWRIAFNAARAEAVRTNVGHELRPLIFESILPLMQGPAGDLMQSPTNTAPFKDRFRLQVYNQMLPELASEGAPTNELREWRWNLLTNYTFRNGPFKGFNIGGGIRWQDKVAIGAPIIVDFETDPVFGIAPDPENPYYGPSETNFDAHIGYTRKFRTFTWSVQLNVRNIGIGDELIPVSAQPDGSIASWRIRAEETWSLRSTFTF